MSLSQLRPLAFGEILDGAFALYRRHFSVFVPTSLLAHAPLMLLWAAYAAMGGDASSNAALFGLPIGRPTILSTCSTLSPSSSMARMV